MIGKHLTIFVYTLSFIYLLFVKNDCFACAPQRFWNPLVSRSGRSLHSNPSNKIPDEVLSIQEQNAADKCLPQIRCDQRAKYRSIDGVCNNLQTPGWGSPNTAFVRLLAPDYKDGLGEVRISQNGGWLPSPRILRTFLFAENDVPDPIFTLAMMQWGQILAHDVTLLNEKQGFRCCSSNGKLLSFNELPASCLPIAVPKEDEFYSKFGITCLEMKRALTANDLGCNIMPIRQVSSVTHFIDGSMIYGSDQNTANNVRHFKGGFLRVQITNDGRLFLPNVPKPSKFCNVLTDDEVCYAAGDSRVNQNIEIAVSQVMFLRLHNWLAFNLHRMNPIWNDETLYQEARRIVIAIIQHITYKEYLPLVLGHKYTKHTKLFPAEDGYAKGYNEDINPSTLSEFAGAAFRSFHSTVRSFISLVNESRAIVDEVHFSDWMNRPGIIQQPGIYDNFLRGLATQPQQVHSVFFSKEVSNLLFKFRNQFGTDLLSLDINRGRDMGIPSYNKMRKLCGLPTAKSFTDLGGVMEQEKIARLATIYPHVNDIDYLVGGLLEKRIDGTLISPSFRCIISEAFFRYKFGDRFYYEFGEQPGSFSQEQLNSLRKVTLSMIICITSDNIKFIQPNGFIQSSFRNPLLSCSDILTAFDLSPWKA